MRVVLEGSQAAAEAVRLARVQVVSAYPITPQTHIVEELAKFCAEGSLDGRFICVESEHSAMASVIGAAAGGVRTFTASSSHGLALMHEMLHWAAGARLPIVMAEVNRALGPGWNLWMDQTDSLAQRDTGWIQFYCADGQEVLDTTLQAYRLAEAVNLPVMVALDAFFLSHTYEPVDLPSQEAVDRFLPPFTPKFRMDTAAPMSLHGVAPIGVYMEMRRSMQLAMESVPRVLAGIEEEYAGQFGRRWGTVVPYRCEDAEIILVTSGTAAGTARVAVDQLREAGEKAGLLRIRMFRPFPVREVRAQLAGARKVAVLDRNCSFGAGGIFASELRSALYGATTVPVWSYITGLGGRDVTVETLIRLYTQTRDAERPKAGSIWLELKEELLQK
ncbi:MAG TPA: pyruvate ferredoxin oxidoreductase [bacterium]|nr:pyruvate ferredoxin oxidoreductase [bacterium]HQG45951.1 pyruvate ferredoxin oxidoreductase [bacterium]HQI48918.1 pyruvate ferredoxin oxidoreductase [bacterium]HQJ62978.1 pyruvate ferredoxin oxidoreductase [bacterium]